MSNKSLISFWIHYLKENNCRLTNKFSYTELNKSLMVHVFVAVTTDWRHPNKE